MNVIAAAAPEYGPGLLGFLIVFGLGVALFLLVKSMNRQIGKIQVPHDKDDEK